MLVVGHCDLRDEFSKHGMGVALWPRNPMAWGRFSLGGACGRCIVFYSKCWVRVVALGGSSVGKGFF